MNDLQVLEKALLKGKKSLVDFYRIFLSDDSNYVKPADFHYKISDILLKEKRHFAIEAFRESGKSEYVLRAFPLYCLTYPKKSRSYIVIIKQNQTLASSKLKEITREYLSNPNLQIFYKKTVEESQKAFEIETTEGFNVRIEAYGKGSAVRGLNWNGKRPDIVVVDDPQDHEDAISDTILEKDWDWFLSDVNFLGKYTRIFMIGNNLGEKCLIERVIENAENLNFSTLRIPAIENGKPTWEAKFSLEELEAEKRAYKQAGKLDLWLRERMCIALSDETRVFKRKYFKYYSPNEVKKLINESDIYITVDLAISEKETADYTAIVVNAVNYANHWFILDVVYGRFNPSETIDHIFNLVKKYNPIKVGIEKVAYQAALEHFLIKEMPRRNIFFNIEPLKADKQKEIRIKALEPRFKAGTIWFPDIADWLPEMEAELLSFPKGKHDDIIDSLAYQEQIAQPPMKTIKENVDIPSFSL
ncbi:MAG: hypothetical protein D6831_02955 [Aquificota bacterium]|nr:MAG: hypothetical protein D6831_02955 [Aquificota bacterium]